MPEAGFILLFVDSPASSAGFYRALLDQEPIEQSPTFAMFTLRPGLMLGLWSRHTAEPAPGAAPGGCEIAFIDPDVDATHADWSARGIAIAQPPCDMDFGRTFLALDPDGHRLRVLAPPPPEP